MVKKINETLMSNSGRLVNLEFVVIHNDAGSMTPEEYIDWLRNRDKALGIAHYYCNRNTIARVIDTFNIGYHTGDWWSNCRSIGYEVCESLKVSDEEFLQNEDMTLMQATEDLLFYGLPINTQTVRLHHEFVSTTCPHRSLELHGGTTENVKEYFVNRMQYFATLGSTVDEMLNSEGQSPEGWVKNSTGWWYRESDGTYPANKWRKVGAEWFWFDERGYCLMNTWRKINNQWYWFDNRGAMAVGWKNIAGSWYYFHDNGSMATGWFKYYDKWYYLNTSNGFMESNAFIKGKDGWYYISEDGTMAEKPDFTVEPEGLITVK